MSPPAPPTLCLLMLPLVLVLGALAGSNAFDIAAMEPVTASQGHLVATGNKALYERMTLNGTLDPDSAADAAGMMDVNEIPVRYDEAQLWRIYNISEGMQKRLPFRQMLEQKFGGNIWKENSKFLDISIAKEQLKAARSFLAAHNIESQILSDNIQSLIDQEQLESVASTLGRLGARTKKATRNGSGMHWKDYHDLETIYAFMREIRTKFPNVCRLYTIGKTAEGRDLKVLRISENPREYKKIWIDGGIHAREWISPATVTFILYQLMSNWENQPAHIRGLTWYIMPVMNPDGYEYSRTVNRLWRKNRSPSRRAKCFGVDLNRNFDIGWNGYGSSTNPCSDTYRGSQPASELETQAVVEFLSKRKYNLESYLTYHSYGQMVVYPWAYKAVKVKDASVLQRVANTAVQRIAQKTGANYRASVTHEALGIAGGGSDDWSRAALNVKYVYTIELRDRGNFGFVLPPRFIKDTALEGWTLAETVAQAIG
ncbi:carboxypeptidase B [Scaptodrosophila lebanonensis]|uniref:Carboxypeptidase B n=1 Tax=Drosophila lebanonensis TaxID=7225 RepID=A0A6J2TSK6_DROLE|nr:carboxypeptidase B [Scaptodrosophila lebanonensis]